MKQDHRRIVVWSAAVFTAGLTAALGLWQSGRAHQKEAAQAHWMAQASMPAWHNADWPCTSGSTASALPLHKPVVLRGHWLADRTVFLDNRPMDGASGFVVVTPLRLAGEAGICTQGVVLVVRGWVPRRQDERTALPAVDTAADVAVTLSGRVLQNLPRTFQLGDEATPLPNQAGPLLRQNADPLFWQHWLGRAPLVGALLQVQAESSAPHPDLLRRHWPAPDAGVERHRAYVAQWFALSALVVGLTLWFQLIRPRHASVHASS